MYEKILQTSKNLKSKFVFNYDIYNHKHLTKNHYNTLIQSTKRVIKKDSNVLDDFFHKNMTFFLQKVNFVFFPQQFL